MTISSAADLDVFEAHRPLLVAHAYRMLGDLGLAEDMVQNAWLRWSSRQADVQSPRAYLLTLVTRLCINELDSARMRRKRTEVIGCRNPWISTTAASAGWRRSSRSRWPSSSCCSASRPPSAPSCCFERSSISSTGQIANLVGKSEPACRKLLERARQHVAAEKPLFAASPEDHRRLLGAFTEAASAGNIDALVALLAEDAVMVTDGGPEGRRVGGIRNLPAPLAGAGRIAAFISATAGSINLQAEVHELNGQPALVLYHQDEPSRRSCSRSPTAASIASSSMRTWSACGTWAASPGLS